MSSVHDRPRAGQGPASAGPIASGAQAALPLVQQRALELARALLPTQRAVLVRALTPYVLALHVAYAPAFAEEEQVAATLAHPMIGLSWPETMRPGRVYTPTPLGRLVLHAYLLERVAGEPLVVRRGAAGRTSHQMRTDGRRRSLRQPGDYARLLRLVVCVCSRLA
jgi:hypothetical protein